MLSAKKDRMCLMQYILNEMKLTRDHGGEPMFDDATITKVQKMAVDG